MSKILRYLAIATLALPAVALADQYVHGYTRSDGTYVNGYYRSSPNPYKFDNYSSRGNTNPYTGQRGHERNEFTSPPAYNQSNGSYSGWGEQGSRPSLQQSNLYGNSDSKW